MVAMGTEICMKISACMIVKNEIEHLPDCFRTIVGHVDEIVIIDTGSTDGTQYLIDSWQEAYPNVSWVRGEFEWNESFSDARNYAIERATGDWIFTVDADDRIAVEDWETLHRFLTDPEDLLGEFDCVVCQVISVDAKMAPASYLMQPRFFRKESQMRYTGAWHNQPTWPDGKKVNVVRSPFRIFHVGYAAMAPDKYAKKNQRVLTMGLKYVEEHPKEARGWYNLAVAYRNEYVLKKDPEALKKVHESCEKAMSLCTTKQAHTYAQSCYIKGMAHWIAREYDEAEQCAAEALKEWPDYLDAIVLRGYVCADARNAKAARYWLNRYLREQEKLRHEQRQDMMTLEHANDVVMVYKTLAALAAMENEQRYNLENMLNSRKVAG